MTWSVYLVKCADNTFYTGVTTDIKRRVSEHNNDNKKGAKYTKARRPVVLIWSEDHPDRAGACRREYEIKRWSRIKKAKLAG
ncbi:GIY-YIG nuclease family protein [Idiomarina aminovorans]|uniref:GIY-YIG nuclease family protein n=1 Tax=Idiomarina aminovorans TaxID=2914829 RepID=UPI002004F56A|nr:GIY-YIG nuclease family protein [Idiomarina sp. ATCH4]